MAVRTTLQIGDPKLKAVNQSVVRFDDPKITEIINDLVDTMRARELIGMAAPQIGENYRLFVTEPRQTKTRSADQSDQLRVYINPTITWTSPESVEIFEGCGSVLNGTLFGPVIRPRVIAIEYQDQYGKFNTFKCDGILSRVIQHEYDHLDGIEFTEKISDYRQLMSVEWYITLIKSNPTYLERSTITIKELIER